MADSKPLTGTQDLSTKTVTYSTELGRGAFATVYRAKCDELPCAAKILFTIFQNDPGFGTVLDKFLTECEYLKNIKHPNVVQYLGLCQEPTTNQPVLLMELMDDSLTHFLDKSKTPLSRHVQLSLCHDVALALAHLHSLGIVHRDLSSNNVLLIGPGSRAKVSDFGMSKEINTRNSKYMTPLSVAPGTVVYMPQEALGGDPNYTEKLDCFSFGVLAIQIMTRIFPNPKPSSRMKTIESDLGPNGTILVPVLETECRKEHIDMINEENPLLEMAVDCLALNMKDRPHARQLCHRIEDLRRSIPPPEKVYVSPLSVDTATVELQEANQQLEMELDNLRQQLIKKSQQNSYLESVIEKLMNQFQMQSCKEASGASNTLPHKPPLPDDLVLSIKCWKTGTSAPICVAMASTTVIANTMCCCFKELSQLHNYDIEKDAWNLLPGLNFKENKLLITFHEAYTLLATNNSDLVIFQDGEWRNIKQGIGNIPWVLLSHGMYIILLCADGSINVAHPKENKQVFSRDMSNIYSPCFTYGSAKICNEALYLIGIRNNQQIWIESAFKVPLCDIIPNSNLKWFQSRNWQKIAPLPVTRSTCVSFNGHLLAVGGIANNLVSGGIFHYMHSEDGDGWFEIGSIPTPRYNCLAEVVGNKLVVVGGWINSLTMCDIVEIATINF